MLRKIFLWKSQFSSLHCHINFRSYVYHSSVYLQILCFYAVPSVSILCMGSIFRVVIVRRCSFTVQCSKSQPYISRCKFATYHYLHSGFWKDRLTTFCTHSSGVQLLVHGTEYRSTYQISSHNAKSSTSPVIFLLVFISIWRTPFVRRDDCSMAYIYRH